MNFFQREICKKNTLASALYDTIEDNNWRGVKYMLLDKQADPNVIIQDTGISPFHLVIGNVSEEFAIKTTKLILQCGGNPNVKTDDGLTPLHIASAWGRIEIVQLLLNFGANYEIKDSNYQTPVDYALEYNHREVAQLLYDTHFANIRMENLEESKKFSVVLDKLIVNNGVAEAEYEVDNDLSLPYSSTNKLKELPETAPGEYVREWCKQHSQNIENELETKKVDVENNTNIFVPFECQHTKTISPRDTSNVTQRVRRLNQNVIEIISLDYESSDRFLSTKKRNENRDNNFCQYKESLRESGVLTISSISSTDNSIILPSEIEKMPTKDNVHKDTSSDYYTCNEVSDNENVVEINDSIISASSKVKINESNFLDPKFHKDSINSDVICSSFNKIHLDTSKDTSFISIAEVFKYTDDKEGITLLEKRLLKNCNSETDNELMSQSSKLSSLPVRFDYDSDTLRLELTQYGFPVGPITRTTKRVYLKKLYSLQQQPKPTTEPLMNFTNKVYSNELESTLQNPNCFKDVAYKDLELLLSNEFSNPDPSRKWREGVNKSSFSYLLLDPRLTKNLPNRAENMALEETWRTFLNSIFYVGKGKRTRPYSHLYEAVTLWHSATLTAPNEKIQHILDIWRDNHGVVCLHIFQNVIPVEAYTREAAMIKALNIDNIKNSKLGQFYGGSLTWTSEEQNRLGALLLYKAMLIFLNEGERQLRPNDIN